MMEEKVQNGYNGKQMLACNIQKAVLLKAELYVQLDPNLRQFVIFS